MKIAVDDSPDVPKAVSDGLSAYNRKVAGHSEPVTLNVSVRDDADAIKGGVVARFNIDTVYIDLVWLDDALRGQGQGRAMIELVESEGRKRGAKQSWLYTLSFQARPFYETLGYEVFGEMAYMDGKHRRFFMRKDL
jgi:GNAT superfamily N-acetyltransferase